jgi:hypothetical protein
MKNLTENQYELAHDYIKAHWYHDENWTDLNIMLDEGDTEMACEYMLGTGAIDSTQCLDDAVEAEKLVEQIGRAYRELSRKIQMQRTNEVFNGAHLFDCEDCNHISFVKYGNEKIYENELKKCWSCGSDKITHKIWGKNEKF